MPTNINIPTELIALNEIQDSNIISVNQKLRLPENKSDKIESAEITLTKTSFPQDAQGLITPNDSLNNLADVRLNSQSISKLDAKTDISSKKLQEKRLAKLRAGINQMRAEIEQGNNNLE